LPDGAHAVYAEFWVSLASLLRSYTAAHRQATVELGEERITVRHAEKWLDLQRTGDRVNWLRENGQSGVLRLTEAGTLRSVLDAGQDAGGDEEEMDMAAEAWARELMQ
jgi:hypothetical protein